MVIIENKGLFLFNSKDLMILMHNAHCTTSPIYPLFRNTCIFSTISFCVNVTYIQFRIPYLFLLNPKYRSRQVLQIQIRSQNTYTLIILSWLYVYIVDIKKELKKKTLKCAEILANPIECAERLFENSFRTMKLHLDPPSSL